MVPKSMHTTEQRDKIKQAFDKAAHTYDQYAILQKQVAAGVEQLCLQHAQSGRREQLLDIGAGTGFVTRPLLQHYPDAQITALDLSQNMLNTIPDHAQLHKVCADFMHLPFEEPQFDVVTSSLALQWGQDLQPLFDGLYKVLRPGGQLVFSTLLEDSLFELRNSWKQADKYEHVNQFASLSALNQAIEQAGLKMLQQRQENITLHYASANEVLKSLKGIGANTVLQGKGSAKGLGGRSSFRQFEQAYETFRKPAGLPLSYTVLWIVAAKEPLKA